MQTSPQMRDIIAKHEGVVLKAYRDVKGVWTIGVGHTSAAGAPRVKAGMRVSRDEAMRIFAKDLNTFEKRVAAQKVFRKQHQFDGAVSFDYNTGAIHKASWVKHFRNSAMGAAEKSLKLWNKSGGKVYRGLTRRRNHEADIIFRGDYGGTHVSKSKHVAADVAAYQKQLQTLGYYKGRIDGVVGPKTKDAVLTFQQSHPQLTNDGVVGPATKAALDRALSAKKRPTIGAAVSAGATVVAAAGEVVNSYPSWVTWSLIGVAVIAAAGVGYLAWFYRDELKQFMNKL